MPRSSVDSIVTENLKEALEEKGRSAYSVASALGKTPHWLYEVLSGKSGILLPTLREVAAELGVTVGSLVDPPQEPDDESPREVTPEEAVENYELIISEPMLALKARRAKLSIEAMADIADYIRFVRSEREEGTTCDECGRKSQGDTD